MTAISNNNVALTLLTMSPLRNEAVTGSAVDAIMSIVSGETQSQPSKAEKPREVGGTVSSEISKAQMSAMSAAGAATVNGLSYDDPLIAFTPTEASAENAEAFVRQAAWSVEQYNRRFEPEKTVPPREEYNARYAQWGADRIANGEDAGKVNREVAYFTSDKMYLKETKHAQLTNEWNQRASKTGESGIAAGDARLFEVFGRGLEITYGEHGVAKIEALDLNYATGQKMLSYGADGSLTIFNEDGSVKSSYATEDVAQI